MSLFNKPALDVTEQLAQWQGRGLAVADISRAQHYLAVVGYYRLSAYSLPFQLGNPDHRFIPNTHFDVILDLYVFDRELRLLVLDAIERIEVGIRSHIGNYMATKYGPHWYLDESHFVRAYAHKALLAVIESHCKRKKEIFVKHYVSKYSSPVLPPSWVVMELLTFGQLSTIYDHMASASDQKAIARLFATQAELLRSWLQTLSYVRNVCAHHSRLWNRELGNAPKVPKKAPASWVKMPIVVADKNIRPNLRFYLVLVVIEFLLQSVNPESTWHQRLFALMQKHSQVSKAHMGVPEDWVDDPFWRL
ncbi:MAG: Abi family protein [Candidatus Sedimenticola sp. (ex Thyasira tokunagai)]